jgi:hypothetical protein
MPKNGDQAVRRQLHDQNGDGRYDELALHRSFSRLKLVSESDDDRFPICFRSFRSNHFRRIEGPEGSFAA